MVDKIKKAIKSIKYMNNCVLIGNLPSEMKHYDNPTLLLWKSNEILLERYTDHIWMRQNSKVNIKNILIVH